MLQRNEIIKKLNYVREEVPLSYMEQAKQIGISLTTLYRLLDEQDTRLVHPSTVRKIKHYLMATKDIHDNN